MNYTRATWEAESSAAQLLGAAVARVPLPTVVAAACACVRLALADARSVPIRYALEAIERWTRDDALASEVHDAVRTLTDCKRTCGGAPRSALDAVIYVGTGVVPTRAHDLVHAITPAARAIALGLNGTVDVVDLGAENINGAYVLLGRFEDAALAEAYRRMAEVVRAHIPWSMMAAHA